MSEPLKNKVFAHFDSSLAKRHYNEGDVRSAVEWRNSLEIIKTTDWYECHNCKNDFDVFFIVPRTGQRLCNKCATNEAFSDVCESQEGNNVFLTQNTSVSSLDRKKPKVCEE